MHIFQQDVHHSALGDGSRDTGLRLRRNATAHKTQGYAIKTSHSDSIYSPG